MRVQWDSRKPQICSYCGEICTAVREHVVARRFFSKQGPERGDLIIVPSCSTCNAPKEPIETLVSIFLPFSSKNEAARRVIDEQIESEINSNSLLKERYLKYLRLDFIHKNGKFVKAMRFYFDKEMQENFQVWAEYVVRGLYRAHRQHNVPKSHDIRILRFVKREHIDFWSSFVANQVGALSESKAQGAIQYKYAFGDSSISSAWMIEVYETTIFVLTHDIQDPALLSQIEKFAVDTFSSPEL